MFKKNGLGDIMKVLNTKGVFIGIIVLLTVIILMFINYNDVYETFYSNNVYTLEYYYMDGCGHCTEFNESKVWESLKSKKWDNITLEKYNRKDKMDRVEKFNITGYPSFILVKDDEIVKSYNGDRTYDSISSFIEKETKK